MGKQIPCNLLSTSQWRHNGHNDVSNHLTIIYSTIYSGADQRKHESAASLAFVRGIHRWPVNSPHKWTVTRKMFPFDDVIMNERRDNTCVLPSSLVVLITAPSHNKQLSNVVQSGCCVCLQKQMRTLMAEAVISYLDSLTKSTLKFGKPCIKPTWVR